MQPYAEKTSLLDTNNTLEFLDDNTIANYSNVVNVEEGASYAILTGEDIRTDSGGYVIDPSSINGRQPFGFNSQSNSRPVYGFTNGYLTNVFAEPEKYVSLFDRGTSSVYIAAVVSYNFNDSIQVESQPVKTFALMSDSSDPAFIGYDDFGVDLNYREQTISNPFNYRVAGGTTLTDEGLALFDKFNSDPTYGFSSSETEEYTKSIIEDKIKQIVNDLQTGVLSRFDTVKTTNKFNPLDGDFQKITSDEASEIAAATISVSTNTASTDTSGGGTSGGSTSGGGSY